MKYNLQWIVKHRGKFDFEEGLTFPSELFDQYAQINDLKDIIVSGTGDLDLKIKRLYVDLNIKGTMILPCAITLEDVEYPFEINSTEVFAFEKPDPLEDVHEVKKDIVILPSGNLKHYAGKYRWGSSKMMLILNLKEKVGEY